MILDADLQFSDAQVVTATAASTNLIDMGSIRDVAVGKPMYVIVSVTTALTNTGTVTITVESDDNSGFSSATTQQTIGVLQTSAAGTQLIAPLYPADNNERYMRLKYTISGTVSTGNVDAFLSDSYEYVPHYADAVVIS